MHYIIKVNISLSEMVDDLNYVCMMPLCYTAYEAYSELNWCYG